MNLFNFKIELDWNTLRLLSELDKFDSQWERISKIEGSSLQQLKSLATIQSIGSSTRIEGATLSDKKVKTLLDNLDITELEDRDSQEVVGYYNVLDVIIDSFQTIEISETSIKNLHNILLKFSEKDHWHKGQYKQHSNAVQATYPDGSTQIIFKTTPPGVATEEAMRTLIDWHQRVQDVHPLVVVSAFVYEFLSIHPFQDGNGRLSRLLTSLLLLQKGIDWIQFISFEHEIEHRKKEYYQALRNCQVQRPNESITEWVVFFISALHNMMRKLEKKLSVSGTGLDTKEKEVYQYINANASCKSGEISEKLQIPKPTLKRILNRLLDKELITRLGKGAGVHYTPK
jgi:Fic family protein